MFCFLSFNFRNSGLKDSDVQSYDVSVTVGEKVDRLVPCETHDLGARRAGYGEAVISSTFPPFTLVFSDMKRATFFPWLLPDQN